MTYRREYTFVLEMYDFNCREYSTFFLAFLNCHLKISKFLLINLPYSSSQRICLVFLMTLFSEYQKMGSKMYNYNLLEWFRCCLNMYIKFPSCCPSSGTLMWSARWALRIQSLCFLSLILSEIPAKPSPPASEEPLPPCSSTISTRFLFHQLKWKWLPLFLSYVNIVFFPEGWTS